MRPIAIFTKTDTGKKRDTNEDSVATLLLNSQSFKKEFSYVILAVADGIGGHAMGEIASELATKKFIEEVTEDIFHTLDEGKELEFRSILSNAVKAANSEIWKISIKKESPIGTTFVGAVIANNHAFIVNIGDSRAYLVSPSKSVIQITKDHTAVQEMLDAQIITKEQAKNHPRRNVLTKALGLAEHIQPDLFDETMESNTLMLCTDGLYGMVDEFEISKTINGNIVKSGEDLVSLANKNGGIDNITIALASYSR